MKRSTWVVIERYFLRNRLENIRKPLFIQIKFSTSIMASKKNPGSTSPKDPIPMAKNKFNPNHPTNQNTPKPYKSENKFGIIYKANFLP